MPITLACPLCGTLVADGAEPEPGTCPTCGARFAGGGESPGEGVALAAAAWGARDLPAEALARRLFEVDPAPAPASTAAIVSDRREGFYRWWVFVRTGDGDPAAVLREALGM